MIHVFKKVWKPYAMGMLWLLGLLWPMMGVHADGTLTFRSTFMVWGYILAGSSACLMVYVLNAGGALGFASRPLSRLAGNLKSSATALPTWVWVVALLAAALAYPQFAGRYGTDVAINVLLYICLGLGLNVVVGLAGLLDLEVDVVLACLGT